MIDRNAMALFVKVVENHSFSKTAQRENVPVSTVSRKISELEKALGVRLLERSTRQLRMTEVGQDYYDRCRRGLEEFDRISVREIVRERVLNHLPQGLAKTYNVYDYQDEKRAALAQWAQEVQNITEPPDNVVKIKEHG